MPCVAPLVAQADLSGKKGMDGPWGDFMTTPTTSLHAEIAALLGEGAVVPPGAAMARFIDEPRRRFHTAAQAVALPSSVEQVQALVRWAAAGRIPLIPQGGNTGLVGGQVPLSGQEVIVSLERLNRIRSIDAATGHMTAEAGVILERAHEAAEAEGAIFPLWIASQGSARIGGVLASNAGGVQVLAYGNARELCLGVEAVTADGRLYAGLNTLRKDNTGYDLKDLLIGSEGTLAILTAATLKLFPKPAAYETAVVNVAGPEQALQLFYRMKAAAGARLTAFELMPRFGIDMQLRHSMMSADATASMSPWYVLVEFSYGEADRQGVLAEALEPAFEAGLTDDAVLAGSLAQRQQLWAMREQMSEVQSREGASIKHDVSVDIADVPQLIAEGTEAAERAVPGIRPCPFGHLGDGNIHFNFSQPLGADPKAFMAGADAVHDAVYAVVLRLGGSVSAEHGIGQLKTHVLEEVKDPVALDMMRAIKLALDPHRILNPGKVLA